MLRVTVRLQGASCGPLKKEATMTLGRIARIVLLISVAILLFGFIASSGGHPAATAQPHSEQSAPHCAPVGGMIMTNFGAIDQNTTMGTATGDLRGAVSGTLLGAPQPGAGNTLVFRYSGQVCFAAPGND